MGMFLAEFLTEFTIEKREGINFFFVWNKIAGNTIQQIFFASAVIFDESKIRVQEILLVLVVKLFNRCYHSWL